MIYLIIAMSPANFLDIARVSIVPFSNTFQPANVKRYIRYVLAVEYLLVCNI